MTAVSTVAECKRPAPLDESARQGFPAQVQLTVETHAGWNAIEQLSGEWEDLAAAVNGPPFWGTPSWFRAWRSGFGETVDVRIVTVRSDGRLVGLLPMANESHRKLGIKWSLLRSLDNDYCPEYCVLLAPGSEDRVFNAAIEHIMRADGRLRYLKFCGVRESSFAGRALEAVAAAGQWHCLRDGTNFGPELCLEPCMKQYEDALPARTRKRLRRDIRRAHRLLELQTRIVETLDELEDALPALRKISKCSWQGEAGTGTFNDGQVGAFYTIATRELACRGQLSLALLTAGGEPAAFELAAVSGSYQMVLKREFDAKHRDAGIGKVALDELYQHAHQRGLTHLSLGSPTAPYKNDWSNGGEMYGDWLIFPGGLKGEFHFACSQGPRWVAKRLLLPDRIRWT